MSILSILAPAALMKLRGAVMGTEAQVAIYSDGEPASLVQPEFLQATRIEIPDKPPELVTKVEEGARLASTDAANAILIHQYLGKLVRVAAADERVWAALTHTTFSTYVRWRWPTSTSRREDPRQQILKYWFMAGSGLAALRFNAIARLWWAAALTAAPWKTDAELQFLASNDEYRFTRIMLSSQQVYMDIMERQYGSSNRLRICILDALDKYRDSASSLDALSRNVAKRMTLLLGYRHLLTRPAKEIHGICLDTIAAAAKEIALTNASESSPENN